MPKRTVADDVDHAYMTGRQASGDQWDVHEQ